MLGMISWFWVVSLEVIGLREVHKCGTDWAAFAAIGYRLLFGTVVVGLYAAIFFGMMEMQSPHHI